MGVKEIIFALSIGSLVFSGELSAYLPYGIGIARPVSISVESFGTGVIPDADPSCTDDPELRQQINRGEAEKILMVKKAEAEAEAERRAVAAEQERAQAEEAQRQAEVARPGRPGAQQAHRGQP